ncbi:MAG TPA: RNA polymerase sigma factor [Planctomycetota bacterium]|nr:RNA polymerase sigma factor [Planctomycetota bacterium]
MFMPSTIWTVILDYRQDPDKVKDLLARRYQKPVYEFAVRQGLHHEDAEDVTQEVFLRVCDEKFLRKADEIRGKFRTVLLAVAKHVIASFYRHRHAQMRDARLEIPLGDMDLAQAAPSDPDFDQLWVQNLVSLAMERLREDRGIAAIRLQLAGRSYHDIAVELGCKETDVTNSIHKAKDRLRHEIERMIAEYSAREDISEEIDSLRRFL